MRALALLAGLAGFALLLTTAGGGGRSRAWPVGWTGYVPLGRGTRLVCDPSTGRATIVSGSGRVLRQGSSQIVCAVDTAVAP